MSNVARGVVLDGAVHEPSGEALAVPVVDAPPLEVRQRELQVIAASARAP